MAITHRGLTLGLTSGLLACVAVAPAFAQDAKTILTKSAAAYKQMKSYSADMITDVAMPQGKMTMKMTLKRAGDKMAMNMNMSGVPGAPASRPGGRGLNMIVLADGKHMYSYMSMMNSYTKEPITPQMKKQFASQFTGPEAIIEQTKQGTLKRLPDAKVEGASTFVVEYKGKPIKTGTGQSDHVIYFIDKSNYRMKRVIMDVSAAGAPQQGSKVTLTVRNEKVNPAFPASAFVFTPPRGATQRQPGAPGMMGMPGR